MSRPKRTRQSAQDHAEPAATAAPARRTRRAAAAVADDSEQQQLHQPRTTRVTRRSQQQQQDAAEAAEQQAGQGKGRQRRQRRTQQQEQEQQSDDEQQQVRQHEQHGTQQGAAGAGGEQLDDFSKDAELIQAVDALGQASADPAAFLQPNTDIAQAARQAAKALLQYTVTSVSAARQPDQQQQRQQPDPQQQSQLYVGDGFDSEQVWLQLDMQLAPLRKRLRKLVGQIADSEAAGVSELITPEVEADLDAVLGEGQQQSDSEQKPGSSDVDEHDGDMMDGQDGLSDSDHEGDAADEDDEQQANRKSAKQKQQLLPVEDRFMRLDEMEAFVAQAEREAAGMSDDEDDDEDDAGLSDEDGPGRGLAGSDLGSDDDAGLEDLLTSSAALVGKKLSKQQQQQQQKVSRHRGRTAAAAAGSDEEGLSDSEGLSDEDTDQDVDAGEIMYKDFFGDRDGEPSDQPGSDLDQDQSDRSDDDQDLDHDLGSDSQDLDLDGQLGSDDEGLVLGSKARKAAAAAAAAGGKKRVHWDDGAADGDDDDVSMSDGEQEQGEAPLSTHEKRLLRMQERIAELEDEALGEKPWHLIGEVSATRRPVNSALEIDMDYDTTNKPPPAPTEEATHSLEDMIKRRIAEARWDDVIRVLPPPPETKKKTLELDDTKAQQGLGEIYESEYVQQATGFTAPDKAEPLRRQAVALFKALCGKLDALSSFAFTPKPVVEELEVRSDVAALAVEEVAPLAVSDAAMRTPGEVYNPQAHGQQKAEAELTQEERKRRRAKKKRAHKNKEAARASAAAARAAASGDSTALAGRKSLATQLAAATSSGLIKKGVAAQGGKSDFGKSSAVFGKIAEQAAAGKEGKKKNSSKGEGKGLNSAMLKL